MNDTRLLAALAPMVGFRPGVAAPDSAPESPGGALPAYLSETLTGVYVQDLHPLLTLETLQAALPGLTDATPSAPVWDEATTYAAGAVVLESSPGDRLFRAKTTNLNQPPATNADDWQATTRLAAALEAGRVAALRRLLTGFRLHQNVGQYAKRLRDRTPLYLGEARATNLVPKSGRFVGYRFTLREADLACEVQRLGLQLSEAQSLAVYLFHSSQTAPVATFELAYDQPGRFQYFDVTPTALDRTEGHYLLGYFEASLTGQALESAPRVFMDGCGACDSASAAQRSAWGRYVGVVPLRVGSPGTPGTLGFAPEATQDTPESAYGLNAVMSFRCDPTELFIRERWAFAPAVQAALKLHFLEQIAFTQRVSGLSEAAAAMAKELLESARPNNPRTEFLESLKALSIEFSSLNRLCLPSSMAGGFAVRTRAA